MEPTSTPENQADSESLLKLFLHHIQLQEQHNEEAFDVDMDKFWEGQWPSLLKTWANSNIQSCDSPLASDSSSSISTRDSSIFSWSESSYNAAKHLLHSPELLSSRFSGFSLFNPGVDYMEWACRDSHISELSDSKVDKQDGYSLHKTNVLCRLDESRKSGYDDNICDSRPDRDDFDKNGQSNKVVEHLDDCWVSDTSDSGSLASLSSQELQRSNSCDEDVDMCHNRLHSERQCSLLISSSHISTNKNLVQPDVLCLKPAKQLLPVKDDLSGNDFGTNQNLKIFETCNGVSYAYCYNNHTTISDERVQKCYSCSLENNDREDEPSSNILTHSSVSTVEKSYLAAPHQQSTAIRLEKCDMVYGLQGVGDSVKVDGVARCSHGSYKGSLPTSLSTAVPCFLQSGDGRELSSHRKARYSAAVKERFASSTIHGYLRFAEQGDSLCYSFFLDDSDEVLFARASRQERKSNKENCEWTYSFHSKKDNGKARGGWKSWPRKENLASDLVANMRVSGLCHLKAKSNQDGRAKEARFVLYDGGGQHQVESKRARSNSKMRGQPLKPLFDNKSSSQAGLIERTKPCLSSSDAKGGGVKTAHLTNGSESRSNPLEAGKEESAFQEFSKGKQKLSHSQQGELAAIIINTSLKEKKINKKNESQATQKDAAGWGIKFLEKGIQSGWGLSFMKRSSSNLSALEETTPSTALRIQGLPECLTGDLSACGIAQVRSNNEKDSTASNTHFDLAQKFSKKVNTRKNRLKVDVTVILPAGDHGLPDNDEDSVTDVPGQYGPTPLLQRWMSGGDCECGGWDMGCGLSVFKAETLSLSRRTSNIALTRNDFINWLSPGKPFKLLTQGYRRKKILVLEIIETGLFSLSFQARVSPLQAFAIAVALFHQQMIDK